MFKRIKNIISELDHFFYKKFGSYKSTKSLENIKEAQIIFSSLSKIGEENNVKFVGGSVRKALSGENIDDIDLATSIVPDEVKERLKNTNIKIYDSGISHGTLTAIINKKKLEITTLRKDLLTDGRHAKVEFTLDWNEDSFRRDFTINSIYVDKEGRIFDPNNGVNDLKNGQVKFIGLAEDRIQEDYLRILRYLRFFTQYSKADHNKDVISSIKKYINGLNKVSNERMFDELLKILNLKNLYNIFLNKDSKEIILNIFPQIKYFERLKEINKLDEGLKLKFDNQLILIILILDKSKEYEYFCHKYKVSKKLRNRFENIAINFEYLKSKKFYSEENMRKLIYFFGKDPIKDLLLFSLCINKKPNYLNIKKLMHFVENCKIPKFPITGEYLKEFGYETGKVLGKKLKSLEEVWIKNNFVIDKKMVEKALRKKS